MSTTGWRRVACRRTTWPWAQEHVAILSGLYGVLRPLDALQPYRLEMGTRWANPRGKDLYAWWGDRIADELPAAPVGPGI